jgi:ABC-type transport system involved in multi-copper enzyme maturation permease subunit
LLLHCLTILAAAAFLLALSVWRVRRTAVVRKLGAPREAGILRRRSVGSQASRKCSAQAIRRVKGAPVVWKELCTPLLQARRQILFNLALWVVVAAFIFLAVAFSGPWIYGSFFIPILILQWLFIIRLGVAAAGSITREKEAHTWAILLATPLSDKEIIRGKLLAAFRRNLPLLIPLLVLYVLAALLGPAYKLGPFLVILSIGAGLVGSVVFLLGAGVYLSTRLKTTAGAVASTLAVYLVPKLFCCGVPGPLFFLSPSSVGGPFAGFFAVTLASPAFHVTVGLLCMRAARPWLRRNAF